MSKKTKKGFSGHIKRYTITGLLFFIPIAITVFIVKFLLDLFIDFGEPIITTVALVIRPHAPALAYWLVQPWFGNIVVLILILVLLYFVGFVATRVIGKTMIGWFDSLMDRIPFIKTVYGGSKKLIGALQSKPDGAQRVVLIDFPHKDMKTVGFITRVLHDEKTRRKLAAVYVPTTPNPTSGYLEIVPLDKVISTNWTVDEAMAFIVSGGAVAPDSIYYEQSVLPQNEEPAP
jgi:uncharacterized membrane protein